MIIISWGWCYHHEQGVTAMHGASGSSSIIAINTADGNSHISDNAVGFNTLGAVSGSSSIAINAVDGISDMSSIVVSTINSW